MGTLWCLVAKGRLGGLEAKYDLVEKWDLAVRRKNENGIVGRDGRIGIEWKSVSFCPFFSFSRKSAKKINFSSKIP